jgi:hypothetical protein
MAFKVHEIKKYNYSFDARIGGPSRLQLWGDSAQIADVNFVGEGSPVTAPVIAADLNSAVVSFKSSALPDLIDMLRNETPVSVTINNQPPGFVFIHTGQEPVGEGES